MKNNFRRNAGKTQNTARSSEKEILPVIEDEISKGILKSIATWIANAFYAKINKEALQTIAALPQIIHIEADRQYAISTPVDSPENISLLKPTAGVRGKWEIP